MSLPLQDAVRTSILSRKWRYMWASLPQLVFDDKFCRESIRNQKNKLVMTIYQVLLLHHGPTLRFTLSLSGLEGCSEIDQLVLFVSNNGIQEFNLHIRKGEPYKLPSSLFSCLQLKDLTLHSCMFKPPPEKFKGTFSCKKYLRVELVEDFCQDRKYNSFTELRGFVVIKDLGYSIDFKECIMLCEYKLSMNIPSNFNN
ncbi:hypothetical protein ACSBR1_004491 [Camellia fascicularis]